ncbi:LIM domain only protein 3 [Dermatophagoides farinae]|uniref:Protein with similarity to mammalian ELMO n=1 Tax=Dermatophagoides farinae TaxID=6954 RepID=A0A922LCI0_DERFA|nr:LIM domain only protein 3-like [Dermatophagoides farinae]KAH9529482.1 Protein with similarity to mammalian ELMO [Dermatophagoides farinae]
MAGNSKQKQVSRSVNIVNNNTTQSSSSTPAECFNCHKPIRERYLLKALDQYWHEDCLKCSCCDCRLGEVGSTLFTKANLILCKRDYLRLFGNTGFCSACNKTIPGFEMVMRAKSNVYHLECFSCFQCHQKFCVGDRFYLYENKILCEYDYEERMLFANLSRSNHLNDLMQRHQQQTIQSSSSLQPTSTTSHHQQQQLQQAHPYHNNNMNITHNHHHQQPPPPPPQQQQQHPNKMDGELCDASSGYGSGDSPFDH